MYTRCFLHVWAASKQKAVQHEKLICLVVTTDMNVHSLLFACMGSLKAESSTARDIDLSCCQGSSALTHAPVASCSWEMLPINYVVHQYLYHEAALTCFGKVQRESSRPGQRSRRQRSLARSTKFTGSIGYWLAL
jgi:hypothetical protein